MNEKQDWGIYTLTDEDLISLKEAISQEEGKRKGERVKEALKLLKKRLLNLINC